jgi:hypothetical protein
MIKWISKTFEWNDSTEQIEIDDISFFKSKRPREEEEEEKKMMIGKLTTATNIGEIKKINKTKIKKTKIK